MPPECQLLAWDTEFFGFRIARVQASALSRDDVRQVLDWCAREKIVCLYFLAGSGDGETTRAVEDAGFHLADIRVTLDQSLTGPASSSGALRLAAEADIPELTALAAGQHTLSRFYFDPGFPRERCGALYSTWIEKSCRGDAQAVFIAEEDQRIAGYITCHHDRATGRIGLGAVAGWARERGVGTRLVSGSLDYFRGQGVNQVTVVTQGRNIAAQRLYTGCGFRVRSVELWYHWWLPT